MRRLGQPMQEAPSFEKRIYVFRCEETGLYAFAADREGRSYLRSYTLRSLGDLSKH
jgi:hypothetical protein